MKKILILLLLLIISFFITHRYMEITNNGLKESNCTDCKVEILNRQKSNNISKFGTNQTKISIAPISIQEIKKSTKEPVLSSREILTNALREIVIYKQEKNNEIKKITKEFKLYRSKKDKEIKQLKAKLSLANKSLKKFKRVSKLKRDKKVKRGKNLTKQKLKKQKLKKLAKLRKLKKIEEQRIELVEEILPVSWREVVAEDDINIFDLAIKYYGNKNEYKSIYQANQNIIGSDFKIKAGMRLKIPIEENYDEEPIILNID